MVDGPTRGWVAARAASRWVRISGMTCSVLPIRDAQPHSQLAQRWLVLGRAADLTVTLCPATCSFTEMVTVTSNRSVMAEPTHKGNRSPNRPLDSRRGALGMSMPQWRSGSFDISVLPTACLACR
jgi:hypothetical protein